MKPIQSWHDFSAIVFNSINIVTIHKEELAEKFTNLKANSDSTLADYRK